MIAGTDDDIALRYGFGAVCQGGNGPGAADFIHGVNPDLFGRHQDVRIHRAVLVGRRHQ